MAPSVPAEATPDALWLYYERAVEALAAQHRELRSNNVPETTQILFAGLTPQEVDEALAQMREELDGQVTLALTAAFEAMIRVDYLERVGERRKDDVSKELRRLFAQYDQRTPLEEILDTWKEKRGSPQRFGDFKSLLQLRHWLAHGRYWTEKSGLNAHPTTAWQIAVSLSQVNDFPTLA